MSKQGLSIQECVIIRNCINIIYHMTILRRISKIISGEEEKAVDKI